MRTWASHITGSGAGVRQQPLLFTGESGLWIKAFKASLIGPFNTLMEAAGSGDLIISAEGMLIL